MSSDKDYVYIKANGIRKELQETNKLLKRIAKAIEKSNKQTDEKSMYYLPDISHVDSTGIHGGWEKDLQKDQE